ncbi:MAG: hypothetical protein JWM43_2041 [Acidobacteriaceae bacterium]|nr:hypothetical protein [Acidobacteriaceae bacterium]
MFPSKLSHMQESMALLKTGRTDASLAEAQNAVELNLGGYREEIALGDALAAAERKTEAREHFAKR